MNFRKLPLFVAVICLFDFQAVQAQLSKKCIHQKTRLSKNASIAEIIEYSDLLYRSIIENGVTVKLPNAKTTALKSRLASYAYRGMGGSVLTDTSKLFYGSPNRGSDRYNNLIKHDSGINWIVNLSTGSLENSYFVQQTFDSRDNIASTVDANWDDLTNRFINFNRNSYTYNAADKILTDTWETWGGSSWIPQSKNIFTYDVALNTISDSSFSWDGTSSKAYAVIIFTYTPTNKVLTSTSRVYESASGTWNTVSSKTYNYDAAGHLVGSISKSLNTATMILENSNREIYTVDASGNPILKIKEVWNKSSSTWVNSSRITSVFDASSNLLTELKASWNDINAKYDTVYYITRTYNSYNQVNTEVNFDWDASIKGWQKVESNTFYYEEHLPTTIKELNIAAAVLVYPIPANNTIIVSANIDKSQKIQLKVLDIQGRILLQTNQNSSADYNQKISVENLPSGHYILSINGDKGFSAVQKIEIVH